MPSVRNYGFPKKSIAKCSSGVVINRNNQTRGGSALKDNRSYEMDKRHVYDYNESMQYLALDRILMNIST